MSKIRSTGDMARELSEPLTRVNYVLMSRGIKHVQKVGGVRVYDQAAFDRVVEELAGMTGGRHRLSEPAEAAAK